MSECNVSFSYLDKCMASTRVFALWVHSKSCKAASLRDRSDSSRQTQGMQRRITFVIGKCAVFSLMALANTPPSPPPPYKDDWGIRSCRTVAILTDLGFLSFNLAAREVLFWSYGCVAELLKTQFPSCPNSSCKRSGRHYRTASLSGQTHTHTYIKFQSSPYLPLICDACPHQYCSVIGPPVLGQVTFISNSSGPNACLQRQGHKH